MFRLDASDIPWIREPWCGKVAAGLFALGFLLDTGTTSLLFHFPQFRESNPVMFAAIDAVGVSGIILLKILTVFVGVGSLYVVYRELEVPSRIVGLAFGMLWAVAGLWNVRLMMLTFTA